MSDQAAIAGDSLGKLNDKIAKQRQKIDDVNQAMTTLALNAIAAGLTLKEYLATDEGKQDAAGVVGTVNTAKPETVVKAPLQLKRSPKVVTPSVTDQATGFMGGVADDVKKGLAAKGITVDQMNGNIIINGKKMDVSATKTPTIPGGQSFGNPVSTYKKEDMSLKDASKKAITDKQSKQFTGAAGDQYYLFKHGETTYAVDKTTGVIKLFDAAKQAVGKVVKAGYGTMKLDPKIPTIVGDRGPEMAFGGMVIPNMSKIPFSSPRYDVNQAAKMFEPIQQNSSASVINLTQNIYPSEGMNTDAFVRQVVSMTKQSIGQDAKVNAKMVGNPMNVSINK